MNEELRKLFRDLADLSAPDREAQYHLRRVAPELRAELEVLLAYDSARDSQVDRIGAAVGLAADDYLNSNAGLAAGSRCGPYRLLQLLGSGGMGRVYLADRIDGEIEQQVAVKLLHPGANVPAFRERFLRERQILASLNHPGIARLLDAGHHEGQPYLAMEYVNGIRIDEYVRTLDAKGVVALLLRVAEAVAYAHRNLIIHCDLKPSNILINGDGQPKLLDFGIAKMLDSPDATRTLERILTPEYASPEQKHGHVNSTSTDIYSLGAVLRRLLNAPLHDDLEAILACAMRPEPEARYASVDLFIADLEAYLAHRPVAARRGNALYHARKFVRRYWPAVAAALLAVGGLCGGLYIAQNEKAVAQKRFTEVRQIANQFLDLDADIRALPGATQARRRIVESSLAYLERLGQDARDDADLALEIANAYLHVARVQGVPGNITLGQFAAAERSLDRAREFAAGRDSATLLQAEIGHDLAVLTQTQDRNDEAKKHADATVALLERLLAAPTVSAADRAAAARLYVNVARSYMNMHMLEPAVHYARRSAELSRSQPGTEAQLARALGVLANASRFSGDLAGALNAAREAKPVARRAMKPNDSLSVFAYHGVIWREALILGEKHNINLGRQTEAIPLLEEAVALAEDLARQDPKDYTSRTYVAMAAVDLGDILRDIDPRKSLAAYDHAARRSEEMPGNAKLMSYAAWALSGSAYSLRRLAQPADAQRRIDKAFDVLRAMDYYPATQVELGEDVDAVLRAQAVHYLETGQNEKAYQAFRELLRLIEATHPRPESDLRHANGLSRTYEALTLACRRTNRGEEASNWERKRTESWQAWDRKLPNNPFVQRQLAASSQFCVPGC
jgi:tRNA A-37 threonylcarbamoyl transferase component Bud32/tetratricopeptide (TPR) repeat protein